MKMLTRREALVTSAVTASAIIAACLLVNGCTGQSSSDEDVIMTAYDPGDNLTEFVYGGPRIVDDDGKTTGYVLHQPMPGGR